MGLSHPGAYVPSLNLASILVADDRTSGRYRLLLEAERDTADGTSVILHDLSQSGLLFEAEPGIEGDAEIMLHIPGIGPIAARTVWTNGSFYGAQFATPLTPDRLKAALAQSKVIWPAFAPPTPLDIEQARSRLAQPEAESQRPVLRRNPAAPRSGSLCRRRPRSSRPTPLCFSGNSRTRRNRLPRLRSPSARSA